MPTQQQIGGIDVRSILYVSLQTLLRFRELENKSFRPERTGGFLGLKIKPEDGKNPYFPLILEIGDCVPCFRNRSRELVQEKCNRLDRMKKGTGQISSWQSRRPEKDRYGGGITRGSITGAFSGLSEEQDEAEIIAIFVALGWASTAFAIKVMGISKNLFIEPLVEACADLIETDWVRKD